MSKISETVDFYLRNETHYALMITGDWGTGKTHYLKEVLKSQVEATPVHAKPEKNYLAVIVSLFGVRSVKDFQIRILLSLTTILDTRQGKIAKGVATNLIRGAMNFGRLGKLDDYIADHNADSFLEFSELVICLDDMERLSPEFKMEELVGYINSLVEDHNVKVIIVANEDKIDKAKFAQLKEKTIGTTIRFEPDFNAIYRDIVNSKFTGNEDYQRWLAANENFVFEHFRSKNLRTLIFALTHFKEVYHTVIELCKEDTKLAPHQQAIFLSLLQFTMAMAVEFRNGDLDDAKVADLAGYVGNMAVFGRMFGSSTEAVKETYANSFAKKYYGGDYLSYYASLCKFVLGKEGLRKEQLWEELALYYETSKEDEPVQNVLMQELGYPKVFKLDDETYLKKTGELLEFVDIGAFDLISYQAIFYYASRFGNPLNLNLDELVQKIIEGIHKGMERYKYIPALSDYIGVSEEAEYPDHLLRIRQVCLDMNEKLRKKENKNEEKELEELFYNDFDKFCNTTFAADGKYSYTAVFANFDVGRFFNAFKKLPPEKRWNLTSMLIYRYDKNGYNLRGDRGFLEKLNEKLVEEMEQFQSGLYAHVLKDFHKHLQQFIEMMK